MSWQTLVVLSRPTLLHPLNEPVIRQLSFAIRPRDNHTLEYVLQRYLATILLPQ